MRKQPTAECLENSLHRHTEFADVCGDSVRKIKLTLVLILTAFSLFAQVPEIVWQQCLFTMENDKYPAICEIENGYIIAQEVYNANGVPGFHGFYDILITKTDTAGNVVWEKCFGGTKTDSPVKLVNSGNSEFYLLGKTYSVDGDIQSGNNGGLDFWIVKISYTGELLWEKTYGGTGNDTPKDFILLPDNGFLFAGDIEAGGGDIGNYYGDKDIWLCKCDLQGEIVWETTVGSESDENINKFIINSEGNIVIAGSSNNSGEKRKDYKYDFYDVMIAEVDGQGQLLWEKSYGGSINDFGCGIIENSSGYIFISSARSNDGDITGQHAVWYSDIWIGSIDYTGNLLWQKCLGGSYDDIPGLLIQNQDSSLTIFGYTFSGDGDVSGNNSVPVGDYSDIWITKLSQEGEIIWQQCYGGAKSEILPNPFTVVQKGENNFVICCETNSGVSFDVNCGIPNPTGWLFEVRPCPQYFPQTPKQPTGPDTIYSGNHPETTFYIDPPANAWEFNWKIEPDTAGDLTGYGLYAKVEWETDFTGSALISAQSVNYCGESNWSEPKEVFVYNTIGTDEWTVEELGVKVYPNPAKGFVVFEVQGSKFDVQSLKFGSSGITIIDIFGQKVAELPVRSEKTVWQTEGVEAGLYFYRVETGGKVVSGKVMVMR